MILSDEQTNGDIKDDGDPKEDLDRRRVDDCDLPIEVKLESEQVANDILAVIIDGVLSDVESKLTASLSVTSVNSIEETKSVSSCIAR